MTVDLLAVVVLVGYGSKMDNKRLIFKPLNISFNFFKAHLNTALLMKNDVVLESGSFFFANHKMQVVMGRAERQSKEVDFELREDSIVFFIYLFMDGLDGIKKLDDLTILSILSFSYPSIRSN